MRVEKVLQCGVESRPVAAAVRAAITSHSEYVMRAERLWEAAYTGLGRSPPAGVCALTDGSALVYYSSAAAAAVAPVSAVAVAAAGTGVAAGVAPAAAVPATAVTTAAGVAATAVWRGS